MKSFGYACFPFLRPYSNNKFNFHSSKCVFIGYGSDHKGYRCLHPSSRIYVARHIVFNETEFPFHSEPSFSAPKEKSNDYDIPSTKLSIKFDEWDLNSQCLNGTPQKSSQVGISSDSNSSCPCRSQAQQMTLRSANNSITSSPALQPSPSPNLPISSLSTSQSITNTSPI